jgi:tetratricopeptide (TPR) repeat protein
LKQNNRSIRLAILLFAASISLHAYPAYSQALSNQDKDILNKILKDNEAKRPNEAVVSQVQGLVDKYPKDYFTRLVMGNTLDRVGMPMQAIEQYQLAVQYGPDSPKAIVELVKAEIGVGQKEAAMRLLKEADKRFPNDREIKFWMGNYYLAKGDIKQAEQKLNEVMKSGPAFFGMGTAQAEIQLRENRAALASMLVDNDLARNPEYPLGNAIKGQALFAMRKYKQALPYLKNAYIAFPLQTDYAKKLTQASLANNDLHTALEPSLVALALASRVTDPDRETQWLVATTISGLPKDFVRAEAPKIVEKLDRQVNNSRWHYVLGEMFDFYGFHELAAVQFYRSYQVDPTQANAAYRLANDLELYFQQYDEALKYLSQAHSLSPGNTEIADRLERLQNRLAGRNADLAWQLKDMLRRKTSPIGTGSL